MPIGLKKRKIKYSLSGISHPFGSRFKIIGDKSVAFVKCGILNGKPFSSYVILKRGEVTGWRRVYWYLCEITEKIPLVRGFIKFGFLFIIFAIPYLFLPPASALPEKQVYAGADFALFINFFILFLFPVLLYYTRRWHGAEHTVIHALWNNDLQNVEKYTRISPRCGTNFVVHYLWMYFLLTYFFGFLLGFALAISLAWEGFLYFPQLGMLAQYITTGRPSKEQLQVAKEAVQTAYRKLQEIDT